MSNSHHLAAWLSEYRDRTSSQDMDWLGRFDDWIVERPERLLSVASACMREDVYAHFDQLWGFLPDGLWPDVARVASDTWLTRGNTSHTLALEALEYCALQQPAALAPYREALFPDMIGQYLGAALTFREATWEEVAFLRRRFETSEDSRVHKLALACLMETRLPAAFDLVATLDSAGFARELRRVGFEQSAQGYRQRYTSGPLHITFAPDYLARIQSDARHIHPTWRDRDDAKPTHRLGGWSELTCGACGGQVHHLITFDPVPPGIGVTGLQRLELVVCLSCIGLYRWRLDYQHDAQGTPSDLNGAGDPTQPEWQVKPIEETAVGLASLGSRWRWQDMALNRFENQNRVGGYPSWIDLHWFTADDSDCPVCSAPMRFLMQLDGSLPLADGQSSDYLWVAGDKGYVFWCDTCCISTVVAQWT